MSAILLIITQKQKLMERMVDFYIFLNNVALFCILQVFLDPAKRFKVDSHFDGKRLVGEQEVELELEHVADFLTVSS